MNIKYSIKTKTKIRFNGQEYDGVEAMPPDVRQAFEQAIARARAQGGAGVHTSTKVIFNGQEYASVDAMPADIRSQYEQAMALYDKDHDGIPDVLETGHPAPAAPAWDGGTLTEAAPLASQPIPSPKNRGRAVVLILIAVLVLAAITVLLLLSKAGLH